MDNPTTIEMKGRYDDFITITLKDRPYTNSSYKIDWNTIAATLFFKAGPFRGQLDTLIEVHELMRLQHVLQEVYQQVGKEVQSQFELLEYNLALTFKLSKLGHLEVEVKMSTEDACLTGSILADQTFLPLWIKEVQNALQSFPPLGY